jgi:ABC-type nitrate/sulfonate/bicarbonate transport system substrate-binding protein
MRRRRKKEPASAVGKVAVSAVVLLALIGGFFALVPRRVDRPAAAPVELKTVSLYLSGPSGPAVAGVLVAAQLDAIRDAGLPFKIVTGPGTDPIAAIVNRQVTFGLVAADAFMMARAGGAPIVAFAANYLESPVVFFAAKRSNVQAPFDFVDNRVRYPASRQGAMIYNALTARLQIPRSRVKEVRAGEPACDFTQVEVCSGEIPKDAYDLFAKGTAYTLLRPTDYGIHVPGSVYVAREDTLRNFPSAAERFLRMIIAGWTYIYADYERSVPLIEKATGGTLSKDQIRFELEVQRDFVLPLGRRFGEFDERQWKMLRDIMFNERLIDDTFNLSAAVNYEVLSAAHRRPLSFAGER